MSGSSTKYYVSSTTLPLFDRTKVVDQFQSAVIDQTITGSLELSEYLKKHYRNTKLWNFRNFISWCKTSGYNNVLGSVESCFYTNADISNTAVAAAIQSKFSLGSDDTFGVNSANLNFFSVDFWIRYLATQQGKATLFGSTDQIDYTLEYPTDTTVKATFSDGTIIQGSLPTFSSNARFLEISYSIDRVTTSGSVKTHTIEYGYYHYQENTGIPALDVLIKENGIKTAYTFFPVIPLRTDTAWLGTNGQNKAGSALKHLGLVAERTTDNAAYWTICNALANGMTQGSMGDIDYITYIPGVNINTRDKSSQKYLFEFFYNCYYNCALAHGETPAHINGGKCTYNGKQVITSGSKKLLKKYQSSGYTRNFYRSFNIRNYTSNLNLTYEWAGAEYYDNNGTFKPNAKTGDYGVLAGKYIYKYLVKIQTGEDEYGPIYSYEIRTTTYNLVFFCHQASKNRWKAVAFADLYLKNLVYHGKYVDTCAYDAVKDSSKTGSVVLDFSQDFSANFEPDDTGILGCSTKVITMEYVEAPGDDDSAFVVPLELTTFTEVGAVCQYQIVSLCHYLIYNCWVKVKKKWYQRGFFSVVVSFVGMVVSFALSCLPLPILSTAGIIGVTYFATMLSMTLSAWVMETGLHLLQSIFGDEVGLSIYNYLTNEVADIVCNILVYECGWIGQLIAAGIKFNIAAGTALNNGESQWSAFRKGATAGGISLAASYASSEAGSAASEGLGSAAGSIAGKVAIKAASSATYAGVSALGTGLLNGGSFAGTIKNAFTAALQSGIQAGISAYASELFNSFNLSSSKGEGTSIGTSNVNASPTSNWEVFKNALWTQVLKNPTTYVNLINMADDIRAAHKLQNLESDYEEVNNYLESANKLLNSLVTQSLKMVTAQESLRQQAALGRLTTMFPETNLTLTWDRFRTLALATGSDHCKVALGCVTSFVNNSLTLEGYSPSSLYYTNSDNTLTWDN